MWRSSPALKSQDDHRPVAATAIMAMRGLFTLIDPFGSPAIECHRYLRQPTVVRREALTSVTHATHEKR
jgi:hypothetical protein